MRGQVGALDGAGTEDSLELVVHDMRDNSIDVVGPILIIGREEDDDVATRLGHAEPQAGSAAMAARRKLKCLDSTDRAGNLQGAVLRSPVDQDHLFAEADL